MKNFKQHYLINESASSFIKFYKDQERGLTPDHHILMDCLMTLANYYADYLQWYEDAPQRQKGQERIVRDFTKQLMNIRKAMVSDEQDMIIAIDQGINQWHHDYPVVAHLGMEAGFSDDEMEEAEWSEVATVLSRLGRLAPQSPYVQ